ncbi:hypothetical protein R4575_18055 [Acinetobacter baumannii]|nr:hypothetical protein [Acinetobacter baumannii]
MFTHHDLVQIASKWAERVLKFPIVASELRCGGSREIPDVIAFRADSSLIIECKTSINDFRKDFVKPERNGQRVGVGNYRIYCAPIGVIPIDKVPQSWGLIEVGNKGKVQLTRFKQGNLYHSNKSLEEYRNSDCFFHQSDLEIERAFLYSILRRSK